jgi:protein-S-isoprenylcysteine O-methyltransferase Ste14
MSQPSTSNPLKHAGVWIPPPLLYVLPFLFARFLQTILPLPSLPDGIRVGAAILFCAIGLPLCAWSIGLFRRSKTSLVPVKPAATLVLDGPYRVTRNPMYLGLLLLYLAAAFWLNIAWALVLISVVIWMIQRLVIEKEELYLEHRFGESYRQYKAHVRRWI